MASSWKLQSIVKWLAPTTVIAVVLIVAASANAERPPAPLLRAESQTAHLTSVRVAMVMSMTAAGQRVRFTASGIERVAAHQASMVVDMSKLNPKLGKMQMISVGSRYYVHLDVLDKVHATRPQIKPWIVVNTTSAFGFDPWSTANFSGSLRGASGYRLLGTSGGVSRYMVEIDLRAAAASSPQLKQLLARAGAAASGLLDKPVTVVLYVGGDGYLHRMVEQITIPISGKSVAMTIDTRLSDFNVDPGLIVAPPANQVMTLAQFKKLTQPAKAATA